MEEVAMRKSRFSESQIVSILKENESGRQVKDICREHGISTDCFYQWKSKYGFYPSFTDGLKAT
jgi:putative transposase